MVVKPLVDALFVYLKQHESEVGTEKLREAFTYALNQEKYLRVFLTDGDVPMDMSDDSAFGETLSQIKEEKTDIKRSWNLRICHLDDSVDCYTPKHDDSGVIWKYPRHDFQCAEPDEPVYP